MQESAVPGILGHKLRRHDPRRLPGLRSDSLLEDSKSDILLGSTPSALNLVRLLSMIGVRPYPTPNHGIIC
jgi:hypothetical protein